MNDKIEKLISQMTLEEKLGQLTQEYLTDSRIEEMKELAERGELGSCILANSAMAGAAEQEDFHLARLNEIQRAAVEKSRLGIPVINGRDVIHGSRTIFPIPLAQAATWDYNLIKDASSIMAEEANHEGVHWTFAPMLDICTDPRWGRIIECPGEDPLLGRMFARASVDGIQGDDMSKPGKLAACAKHYIGYGASSGGRDKDATEWSDYSLRNRALPAFKEAVDAGIATVMSAFNEISGQPASASRYHLTDILRGELGFEGFVVSDWDAVLRLKCQGVSDSDETSAALAVNAGVDMDMVDCLYKNNLKSALDKGIVTMETIDEAVRRVLKIKFDLGLFDNPYFDENSNYKFMTEHYLEKAKEVSMHSMVLLKNNGILPLKKGSKVAVSGPMAENKADLLGSWHAGGRASDVVSLAEGVSLVNGKENTYVNQCDSEAVYRGRHMTDTFIIALGEPESITGESMTVPNIEISKSQLECVKAAKAIGGKVIAVIFAGRPLAITEILSYCDAVLWAWHGGTMTGLAASEILFGDFNPCGRLPITLPRSTGQIPINYNHQRNEFGKNWYYETTYYAAINDDCTPAYVFGYGLSYTDFEYNNFEYSFNSKEQKASISFDITNTGKYDGWDTAQCYVTDVVASASRPVKELKAFKKVYIQKGETKKVSLDLTKDDLSFYDLRGNWVFEPGDFVLQIGKNCKDICFESKVNINFCK
ncbi:MAG: glycoside hydrolase family 3 C-terminal domain-containing protein [Clostridia bacterium]|nr:glycoside hydrolase family 3 C-terminal domain-containing protein [Clostridia bacterium]